MSPRDAEVVLAAAACSTTPACRSTGPTTSSTRLFLAADRLPQLLESSYDEPELTVVVSEALHAVIGHRRARRADHGGGRHRARGRRARHGERPLAHPVRDAPAEHPLDLGGGHRRGHDRARRGARRAHRDRDEQLERPVPGRRAAGDQAARLRASRSTSRWWPRSTPSTRSGSCRFLGFDVVRFPYARRGENPTEWGTTGATWSSCDQVSKSFGDNVVLDGMTLTSSAARPSSSRARPGRASRRCCAASTAWSRSTRARSGSTGARSTTRARSSAACARRSGWSSSSSTSSRT